MTYLVETVSAQHLEKVLVGVHSQQQMVHSGEGIAEFLLYSEVVSRDKHVTG